MPRFQLRDRIVDLDRALVEAPTGLLDLSPLEAAVLGRLLAEGGRLVSKAALLREVWGYRAGVETRAVDNTVRRLRVKLEQDPARPVHLVVRYGQGLRLDGAQPVG